MSHRISLPCRNWRIALRVAALVFAIVWVSGCAPDGPPPAANGGTEAAVEDDGHHEHEAPHGGTLVELGDEFAHVELVLDAHDGTLTAYVLDGEAEQAVRIAQPTLGLIVDAPATLANRPLELQPRASALTGEKPGDASEFGFSHDALRGVERLTGRILDISVRGQTFRDVPFVVEPPVRVGADLVSARRADEEH